MTAMKNACRKLGILKWPFRERISLRHTKIGAEWKEAASSSSKTVIGTFDLSSESAAIHNQIGIKSSAEFNTPQKQCGCETSLSSQNIPTVFIDKAHQHNDSPSSTSVRDENDEKPRSNSSRPSYSARSSVTNDPECDVCSPANIPTPKLSEFSEFSPFISDHQRAPP
eukprot:CAMPEP_0172213436 /NCGR_PEP_ID=MMETSP1050-20130122/37592_1 /TAXON_ID=233186 /ORGANISM="Cryptomonas curvata, Strain CCAP979/52" /LENGTH=167 /DNA_ID=CAMNT_0012894269 /DNA_START=169 /DNA_END=669 /DNA_ORIENTATION=-